MKLQKFLIVWIGAVALLLLACSSSRHVSDQYNELIGAGTQATSRRTTLVFLIDGLPVSLLREGLSSGRLPRIKKYFMGPGAQFYLARTTFPSLTFSSIGALLTEKPPNQNGIFGNRIFKNGQRIDFASPENLANLNQMIQGENIFARLRAKGLKTVSFDYAFTADADAYMEEYDSEAALAILDKNYAKVDAKLLESLRILLERTNPQRWPDFVFVHLIGLDLLSHDRGPRSAAVKNYLEFLDLQLASVFRVLEKVESTQDREIVALMTSDHGYDKEISKILNLQQVIQNRDPKIQFLNEGRYLGLYFPSPWSESQRSGLMQDLISHPLIDLVAYKDKRGILVQSRTQKASISYGQEEKLDHLFYPYFMSNLSFYFASPGHPDALVLPKPGVSLYKNGGRGQHGGPTPQEVFVPLLMHNGVLGKTQQIPPLWELLKFM